MSSLTQTKTFLAEMLAALEAVEKIGDLHKASALAQSRFDRLKAQEDELAKQRVDLLDKAKSRADELVENAQRDIAAQRAQHERSVAAIKEHAVAELDNIMNQRKRLDDEIAALKLQAENLRSLVEGHRQELAGVNDALAIAKTAHDGVKKKLAELKQAL